jgi:hypothetical protein
MRKLFAKKSTSKPIKIYIVLFLIAIFIVLIGSGLLFQVFKPQTKVPVSQSSLDECGGVSITKFSDNQEPRGRASGVCEG